MKGEDQGTPIRIHFFIGGLQLLRHIVLTLNWVQYLTFRGQLKKPMDLVSQQEDDSHTE